MWCEWPFRPFVRLNCVPNTHVTALCYRKIRSFPEAGGTLCACFPVFLSNHAIITLTPPARLQTKKLRRIDCNNRYCVWSKAHPQPVNLCQPCYCDKVREPISSRLGPLKLHSLPIPPDPALTQSPFHSIASFSSLPFFFPSLLTS